MNSEIDILNIVVEELEEMKAKDINVIDVSSKTTITDHLIIVSGTSTRHIKSMADAIIVKTKEMNHPPLGIEGERNSDWILVDLGEVIVHIMIPETRDFYQLEKLWSADNDVNS